MHGLCIELFVVGRRADVDGGGEFHAEEPAATRRVGQHICLIGGGDERGASREVLDMPAVGTLDFDGREGDDVLQESLLRAG